MFCYVYGDYFEYFIPGHIQDMINGKVILDTPVKLLAAAILMAIPALMIFLSLMLKPVINRWLNIILGSLYTVVMLLTVYHSIDQWRMFYIFFGILEIVLTMLIVRFAWTWPRQSQQPE